MQNIVMYAIFILYFIDWLDRRLKNDIRLDTGIYWNFGKSERIFPEFLHTADRLHDHAHDHRFHAMGWRESSWKAFPLGLTYVYR